MVRFVVEAAADLLLGIRPIHFGRSLGTAAGLPKLVGKSRNFRGINVISAL
jgi:hypothetical protein